MKDELAQVFGCGDVTVATNANARSLNVWIGQHRLSFVSDVQLSTKSGSVSLQLTFPRTDNPELSLRIEEEVRIASEVSWVTIIR